MHRITGKIQHYAWGSYTAIPELLGAAPSELPAAEYWLGSHHSGPSILDTGESLPEWLTAQRLGPAATRAFGTRLPFLLKILSAEQPLSLQAHPSREQAEDGYAKENAAGIALDAPNRTYRDNWPKPEALVALTDFTALCGFREPHRTMELIRGLELPVSLTEIFGPLIHRPGAAGIAECFLDILSGDTMRHEATEQVVSAAVTKQHDPGHLGRFASTIVAIDQFYPGDPGILAAMLLNIVTLDPGDAIFLPAGNMHAYIHGTGVEVMANSDNVVRGGLTPKHIDVDELVRVVDFTPLQPEAVPTDERDGVIRYLTQAPEFALWRIDLPNDVALPGTGARIGMVTSGSLTLSDGVTSMTVDRGQSFLVEDRETHVTVDGRGQLFVAGTGMF
ncbi:MAG: mannose-6-phosphate isomerase, class I [Propionibacteriaceae bacterium]